MGWLLFALCVVIVWAAWFALRLPLFVPMVGSAAVVVAASAGLVFRRLRARGAASALEKAILQQGEQQTLSARPELRDDIEALRRQIESGIRTLERSVAPQA